MHCFGTIVIRGCRVKNDTLQTGVKRCQIGTFSLHSNNLRATHSRPRIASIVCYIRSTERSSPETFCHFHESAMSFYHTLLFPLFIYSINLYKPLLRFFQTSGRCASDVWLVIGRQKLMAPSSRVWTLVAIIPLDLILFTPLFQLFELCDTWYLNMPILWCKAVIFLIIYR